MAGDSLGSLVVKISADMADMKSGLDRAAYLSEQTFKKIDTAGKAMEASLKGVAAGLAAGFSVNYFKTLVEDAVAAASSLQQLSEVTGGTVETLSKLVQTAKLSNTANETLQAGLAKLAKGMAGADDETQGAGRALAFLGLSAHTAEGGLKRADDMLLEVATGLDKYADGTSKTAIAQELLGKSGANLLPLLHDLVDAGGLAANITAEQAKRADDYEKNLKRLAITKNALSLQIVQELVPAMNALAESYLTVISRNDGLRGAIGDLAKDGTIQDWAGRAALAIAAFYDFFQTTLKQSSADLQEFRVWVEKAALAISILVTPQDIATHAVLRQAIADDSDMLRRMREEADKGKDALFNLTLANLALARSGRQDYDARDLRLNPPAPDKIDPNFKPKITTEAVKENKEFADAIKFLIDQMNALNGVEKNYAEGLKKLLLLWDLGIISTKTLQTLEEQLFLTETKAGKLITERIADTQRLAEALRKLAEETAARYQAELAGVKASNDALEFQNSLYGKAADEQIKLTIQFEAQRKLAADLAAIYKQWGDAGLDNVQVAEASDAAWAAYSARLGRIPAVLRSVQQAQESLVGRMEFEVELIGLTNAERDKAIALRALETSGIDRQSAEYEKLAERIKTAIDTRELRTTLVDLRNSLTDTIVSAFESGSLKSAVRTFVDWLKKEFEKLVLRPLIEPIAGGAASFILTAFGAGASGTAAAGTSGAASADFSSLLGLSSGITNNGSSALAWLTGAGANGSGALTSVNGVLQPISIGSASNGFWSAGTFGNVGTAGGLLGTAALGALAGSIITPYLSRDEDASRNGAIGGGAGAVIGSYLATGTAIGGPWGAVIGAVIGIVAAAFSDADGPAMRTASVVAGATLDRYTYAMESKLGTLGIARGSDTWFSDSEMGDTLTEWFKTIENIDNSVAARLTDAQLVAARLAVNGGSMTMGFGIEHEEIDPRAFGRIAQDRYGKIFTAIDAAMGALITNFSGTTGDLLKLVDDLATVNYQITTNGEALARVIGQTITFADIQAFNVAGETYTATLQRIGSVYYATNAIAVMFGKSQEDVWGAVGLASESARQSLIEAAGGLDAFSKQLASYYDHYYSQEEKLQHLHDDLAATFDQLGFAMPTTLAGFRNIMEHLDLTTEAGRAAYTALMAVEGRFYSFVTASDSAGAAIAEVEAALASGAASFAAIFGQTITLGDIKQFQRNGEVLTETLARVTSEFNATNTMLIMFGIDSKTVFGEFSAASEAARAKVIELAGGIEAFTSKLNSFYQNYFTQEERNARNMAAWTAQFAKWGITLPTTTQGLRDLYEQWLPFIGLDGPMGDTARAIINYILDIQGSFKDFFDSIATSAGGLIPHDPIVNPDRPGYDDYYETVAAANAAHDALVKLNEELHKSFKDAYRTIEMAGLSNQQQYEYLQREAAGYTVNMQSASTGEEVQMWAEKIKADMLAAFNLLSPDEQLARKDEFLQNLLLVEQMATDRLAKLDPTGTLTQPQASPATAAAEAQTSAARTNQEAAARMNHAAGLMEEAATGMLVASQTTKRHVIEFPQQGITMEAGA